MTPHDIQHLLSTIHRVRRDGAGREVADGIFPRLRWSADEVSVFAEGLRTIDIELDQAVAVVRNLKRTCDKYPSVSLVTKALKAAEPREARTVDKATGEVMPSRLERMRAAVQAPSMRADWVVGWYWRLVAFPVAVELHGCVRRELVDQLQSDLFTLGGMPEDLAAEQAMKLASMFPSEPPADYPATPAQVWYVEMRANGKTDPVTKALPPERSVIADRVVTPDRRRKAREAWGRMTQMRGLAGQEAGR